MLSYLGHTFKLPGQFDAYLCPGSIPESLWILEPADGLHTGNFSNPSATQVEITAAVHSASNFSEKKDLNVYLISTPSTWSALGYHLLSFIPLGNLEQQGRWFTGSYYFNSNLQVLLFL